MVSIGSRGRRLLVVGTLSVMGVTALGQSPALAAAPVAMNDGYSTPAGTTLVVAAPGVLANDTDADGDRLTAGMPSDPGSGSLVLNSTGGFTYTPKAGFTGTDSFTYMVHGDAGGAMPSATVVITVGSGGGGGTPSLSIGDVSVTEGNAGTTKMATFTITRTGSTAGASTVKSSTVNATAMSGSDYTAVPATTVSFAAGETSKTVNITVLGDNTVESDETFKVKLTVPTGATISDAAGIGTIVDDDQGGGGASAFSVDNVTVNEANNGQSSTATFTVTRSNGTGTASVKVVTAPGTATKNVDYTHKAATVVSFAAGETSKMVTVNVIGDNVNENNETFFLKLTTPVNGTIAVLKGKGTIIDND